MKKKEIPNFVFTREYDYYFLFTEFDIVFNEEFYKSFYLFLKKLRSDKLTIRLDDLSISQEFYDIKKEYIYNLPSSKQIELFHNLNINNVPIYNINHFIIDSTNEWEIFVSIENELSIFAVNKVIFEIFKNIFKPYQEESLDVKLNVISGQFVDEIYKNQFIKALISNYKFNNY